MNTVTLPKNKYVQILNAQEKLQSEVSQLQDIISRIACDEISSAYATKLSKIEKGLSRGTGTNLKNKSEVKKFFRSL